MSNFKTYFAIEKKIKAQGFDIEREDIISQFTEGKKSGLSALTPTEYRELIKWLNVRFPSPKPVKTPTPAQAKINLQRRKIISIFRQMGYELPDGKADMAKIYTWVEDYGYLKKPLNKYQLNEIPRLVYQAEKVLESFLKSI